MRELNPGFTQKLPQVLPQPWKKLVPGAPTEALDLLSRLLEWDPRRRMHGLPALLHPYFDELREEGLLFPNGNCLPDCLNFSFFELGEKPEPQMVEQLIPEWY